MRKFLLSAAALVAAMSVNAQVFQVNGSEHGLSSDLSDVAAGYEWGSIDGAIKISNAFATSHKVVDCKNNDFNIVTFDGNEALTKDGVQGNDNPKDADGGNPALSLLAPVGGAVIQINAEKDGWCYIVAKLSTNKQYMVFEEGAPIGYKIAMESADERVTDGVINLEIEGEGEFNNIPEGRQVQWVIREYLGDAEAATAGNGLGVLYFPVFKDCQYYAHATGSKISWSAIYFSEAEAQSVVLSNADGASKTIINGDPAGIATVKNEASQNNGAIYNVAGQQVDKNYKGLVIKNGKKMLQK